MSTIYAGESDGCENGDPVANQRSDTIGDVGLGTIGFDKTVVVNETVDMPYKIDA
jgi:hypothetical protein